MHCPRFTELPAPPQGQTGWPWTAESAVAPATLPDGGAWPTISIVTPNYNFGHYIEATLRSVLLQGYPALEYVVIDGGSTDASVPTIRNYAPWLASWSSEKDAGHYNAVSKGFARTTGEIMAWLNSDDMYHPNALRTVATIFAQCPEVQWLTTSCLAGWNQAGEWVHIDAAPGFARTWFYRGWHMRNVADLRRYKQGIQQESTFWRRSLWEKAGSRLDETFSLAADYELWARFWEHADLATARVPIAGFRHHADQQTWTRLEQYYAQTNRVLERYRGRVVRQPLAVRLLEAAHAWTGRGAGRFGSRQLTVHYDFKSARWYTRARPVI